MRIRCNHLRNVVAVVDGKNYTSLQDAVDAVADKGTITVNVAGKSATVRTAKTFTVTGEKATITAGSGYTLSEKDGVYTVTKYVPYYPVVTPTTPSTDTLVESADTFDGGIALAVAVSILSVTGSAMLLRKKED